MPGHESAVCLVGVAQGRRECSERHADIFERGIALGKDGCAATHREARKAWRREARTYLERHSLMVASRAVSRGRWQGAAVVGALLVVAVWLGRWRGR